MANYSIGILIVVIILVLAAWASGGSRLLIGGLVVICAAALAQSVVDGDSIDGAADRPKAVFGVKFKLRDILRNAKSGAKSAMALTAVGATAGFGGDTIVEILGLVLESTVWLAEIASVFLTNTADYGVTLRQIWNLDFSRGIDGFHTDMARVVADAGGPTSDVFGQVRRVYEGTIEWLISMFGSVVSACIPDDAGVAGWALTELGIIAVRAAPTTLWWTIDAVYRALPQAVRDILQNPGGLESMAVYAIKTLETYVLNGGDDKWW